MEDRILFSADSEYGSISFSESDRKEIASLFKEYIISDKSHNNNFLTGTPITLNLMCKSEPVKEGIGSSQNVTKRKYKLETADYVFDDPSTLIPIAMYGEDYVFKEIGNLYTREDGVNIFYTAFVWSMKKRFGVVSDIKEGILVFRIELTKYKEVVTVSV